MKYIDEISENLLKAQPGKKKMTNHAGYVACSFTSICFFFSFSFYSLINGIADTENDFSKRTSRGSFINVPKLSNSIRKKKEKKRKRMISNSLS